MTSQLNVDTIKGNETAGSITIQGEGSANTNLQQGLAKAWYVFDQVNSNTIDDSLNIGSITDRGTGSMYGVFTNSMNSLHYTNPSIVSPVASGSMATDSTNRSVIASADTTARNSVNVFGTDNVTVTDEENVQSIVHGDLA